MNGDLSMSIPFYKIVLLGCLLSIGWCLGKVVFKFMWDYTVAFVNEWRAEKEGISMADSAKPTLTNVLLMKLLTTKTPVTRSVLAEIVGKRIDGEKS